MTRALTLLLSLLLLVLPGGPVHGTPLVVPVDQSVEISIRRMTPVNPQPGDTLRLQGRLHNRGEQDLTALQVRLLLSSSPLATRSEIPTLLEGSAERDGPPTLAVSPPIPVLARRDRADWFLEIPVDDLPLSIPGVYVAGVEVIGTGADGAVQRVGLLRTFLPWVSEGALAPSRLVWLWPLTAYPDRALDSVQLSERTAAEMAPGGRLALLAGTAGDARVTRVLDPALLQTARDMTDGYLVMAGGQEVTGAGSAVAEEWLQGLAGSLEGTRTAATAYGLPDAMALERADLGRSIEEATGRAAADVSAAVGGPVTTVLAWPPGGAVTPTVLRRFARGGATTVLLSDAVLPPSPGLTYTADGFTTWAGLDVALADGGLAAALAMPQNTVGEALLARQRFLAELAMIAGELPDAPRSVIAAPDPLWSPRPGFLRQTLRALQTVPYARLTSLAAARSQSLEVARTRIPYTPGQRAAELPQSYMARIQDQRRHARRLAGILTAPTGFGYDEVLLRQTSSAWRGDIVGASALVDTVDRQIRTRTEQVRVVTSGTFTLPGDTGRIPVTVANDLSQDVTVGIRLESAEQARLIAPQIEAFDVPAGRKVSLEVEAKVVGSGTLPVTIHLVTPAGRDYGEPVPVLVRTTAYSQAAAYVVTGAFVILAFLLGMNFVRRTRARHQDATP